MTSRGSAALRDALRTLWARDPTVQVLVSPTPVQGRSAAFHVVRAIQRLDRSGLADVILVIRGGGSLEDLWAFNEEPVARAIAGARTPVVTGIGHETDATVADLVADRVAPTPTGAAAVVLPVRAEVERAHGDRMRRLRRALAHRLLRESRRLHLAEARLRAPQSILHQERQRLDELEDRITRSLVRRLRACDRRLEQARARMTARQPHARLAAQRARLDAVIDRLARAPLLRRLDRTRETVVRRQDELHRAAARTIERDRGRLVAAAARLEAISPLAVLARGYAVVSTHDGGVVRSAAEVQGGDRLDVRLARGRLSVRVEDPGPVST